MVALADGVGAVARHADERAPLVRPVLQGLGPEKAFWREEHAAATTRLAVPKRWRRRRLAKAVDQRVVEGSVLCASIKCQGER